MFNKIKNHKIIKVATLILFISFILILLSIDVYAAEKTMHVTYTGHYENDNVKHKIRLDGADYAYCIQKGYTLKDMVSDLDNLLMEAATSGTAGGKTLDTWMSEQRQEVPYDISGTKNKWNGWGTWKENDDHTDSVIVNQSNAPSGGTVGSDSDTNTSNAKPVYEVVYKSIGYDWGDDKKNALALLNYYIPDTNETNEYTNQVFSWAIEAGDFYTNGSGDTFRAHFTSSFDSTWSPYLNSAQMVKYREFCWKVTNLQQLPSFSKRSAASAGAASNIIHLKYDKDANGGAGGYTATVADANGMMRYFDFASDSIPGCNLVNNGDGSITITTINPAGFTGKANNNSSAHDSESTLVPSDGNFGSPTFWRWKLEGKEASFKFSYQVEVEGHKYKAYSAGGWQCKWHCTTSGSPNHCSGRKNTHSCSVGGCGYCSDPCCSTYHHYGGLNVHVHNHTTDACYHEDHCTCRSAGVHTSKYDSHCTVTYDCTKQHIETKHKTTPTGKYKDWQDLEAEISAGPCLIDPPTPYIAVKCDIEEHPAETDVEILLVADNSSYNNKTYTYDDGSTISYTDHIRPNEKYNGEYNIEMVQEYCK